MLWGLPAAPNILFLGLPASTASLRLITFSTECFVTVTLISIHPHPNMHFTWNSQSVPLSETGIVTEWLLWSSTLAAPFSHSQYCYLFGFTFAHNNFTWSCRVLHCNSPQTPFLLNWTQSAEDCMDSRLYQETLWLQILPGSRQPVVIISVLIAFIPYSPIAHPTWTVPFTKVAAPRVSRISLVTEEVLIYCFSIFQNGEHTHFLHYMISLAVSLPHMLQDF